MPYPEKIVRVAITAAMQDGEAMVHTLHVKNVRGELFTQPELQGLATGIRDKWTAMLTTTSGTATPASLLASSTIYQRVTAYDMDPATGRARDLAEAAFGATAKGTASGTWPTEVAICATLGTGFPGRSKRGRLYLGGLGNTLALTATGRISPAACTTFSGALATFMRAVRDIDVTTGAQDKWEPHICSVVRGESAKIKTVSVGDVFDVQRRRRNKINEIRTLTAVP